MLQTNVMYKYSLCSNYVSCYCTKQYSSVTWRPLRMVLHYSELEFVFVFSYSDESVAYQSQISKPSVSDFSAVIPMMNCRFGVFNANIEVFLYWDCLNCSGPKRKLWRSLATRTVVVVCTQSQVLTMLLMRTFFLILQQRSSLCTMNCLTSSSCTIQIKVQMFLLPIWLDMIFENNFQS